MVVRVANEQGFPWPNNSCHLDSLIGGCDAALSASPNPEWLTEFDPNPMQPLRPGILIDWVDCFEQAPLDECKTLFGIQ